MDKAINKGEGFSFLFGLIENSAIGGLMRHGLTYLEAKRVMNVIWEKQQSERKELRERLLHVQ